MGAINMNRTLFLTGVKILGEILSANRTLFTPFMGLFSYKADKVSALSGQLIREADGQRESTLVLSCPAPLLSLEV